ncbi:LLM class flavin-dependent oxidoreductase [Streptomyces sp. NBC_01186]|uniref:LLM class flavin-dependent oxidoreductase n=1 Tax=unclassified Streptomyces TaxID=2593676 RepID=UPI002DD93114|nr:MULTISPECIES: LLM class flavin-dependent oxidoreductase [unclassified Streptomyces]WSB79437.1 LLM class flavin-dependent oxidoreductase [Streptomyces sp. NBC_01775]WSS12358.1 LLM class flavin-dependent oxidoreductase [Streptomyces sp. NBC_01186]
MTALGVVFRPQLAPERLRGVVRAADQAGLEELWLWEDCFLESGIATASAALAWTERLRVGVGLLPVPLRNVALTTMETATLRRLFPGRFAVGLGHGVQDWMGQVGARAESPVTLLREHLDAMRALLRGERVSVEGRYVKLDAVALDWPPAVDGDAANGAGVANEAGVANGDGAGTGVANGAGNANGAGGTGAAAGPYAGAAVLAGARGPRSLRLAGEAADGTVLDASSALEDVRAARRLIDEGRAAAGRTGHHTVVVYLHTATGPDATSRLRAELEREGLATANSHEPALELGVAGDAATVAKAVQRVAEAGADTVVLQPTADEPDPEAFVRFAAEQVRPLVP